ncbi:hypothetical protein [Crossiella sp. CA198]|uniref:hypothetical protein n=1 Tax=Crossiella sp. CA198 TaxID=3455607 RepID=UPI003F8CFEF2
MTTHSGTTHTPGARRTVEEIDRRYRSSLCTAPVLDTAAGLLDAWWETATEHGADITGYQGCEWVDRLAVVAVEMATRGVREPRPSTPEEATALLDAVAARLAERGVTTSRDVLYVPLPRTATTPAWGAFEPRPLAITVHIERGWELVIDQPGSSPVTELVGRCDESGIDAMLDLVIEVNAGAFGNIFAR